MRQVKFSESDGRIYTPSSTYHFTRIDFALDRPCRPTPCAPPPCNRLAACACPPRWPPRRRPNAPASTSSPARYGRRSEVPPVTVLRRVHFRVALCAFVLRRDGPRMLFTRMKQSGCPDRPCWASAWSFRPSESWR